MIYFVFTPPSLPAWSKGKRREGTRVSTLDLRAMRSARREDPRGGEQRGEGLWATLIPALPSRCPFLLRAPMRFSSKHKLVLFIHLFFSLECGEPCWRRQPAQWRRPSPTHPYPRAWTSCKWMKRPRTLRELGWQSGGSIKIKDATPVFCLGGLPAAAQRSQPRDASVESHSAMSIYFSWLHTSTRWVSLTETRLCLVNLPACKAGP